MNLDAQKEDTCLEGYIEYQETENCEKKGTCKPERHKIGGYKFG